MLFSPTRQDEEPQLKTSLFSLLSGLCFILIFSVTGLSQELPKQEPGKTSKAQQRPDTYNRGTKDLPVTIEIAPSAPLKIETDHDEEAEEEKSWNEWLIAQGTVAIAVFTLALACATIALAVFTYNLWGATGKLVRGAEDTAQRQMRAYMCLDACTITISPVPLGGVCKIYTGLKNCGQTPAYKVRAWAEVRILDAQGSTDIFKIPGTSAAYGMIGPGTVMQWDKDLTVTHADLTGMRLMNKIIYNWGEVTYEDAFGKPRITPFKLCCYGNGTTIDWKMKPSDDARDGD